MDDILVGDFVEPFILLQTASGAFTYRTDNFLQSLVQGWLEPTLPMPHLAGTAPERVTLRSSMRARKTGSRFRS